MPIKSLSLAITFGAAALTPTGAAQGVPGFWGLGDLPGGATESYAFGISQAGDVIAGESLSAVSISHGEGVRWQRASATTWQIRGLGLPADDALNSPAAGVSAGGQWIVGRISFGPPTAPGIDTDAYRWSQASGFERLGLPPNFVIAAALGVSARGDVVVGYGGPNASYTALRALVWTKAAARRGSPAGWTVAFLETQYDSQATRVDDSGRLAVGWGNSPAAQAASGTAGREAALWVRVAGGASSGVQRVWLGASPNTVFHSQASGLARLPSTLVIVGFSGEFAQTTLPVFWTAVGDARPQLAELPLLPGLTSGAASAISADGRRIVGTCWGVVNGNLEFESCIWEGGAVSSLGQRLIAAGVTSVAGWSLWSTSGVSGDGTILCGTGTDPNGDLLAWAAELP